MPKGIKGFQKGHQLFIGEKHPGWKGEAVGDKGLHHWIRKHLPSPPLCEICHIRPPRNLANKTGIYSRDLENWFYLCIRCHRRYDNTMPPGRPRIPDDRRCGMCDSSTSTLNSKGTPNWYRTADGFLCHNCRRIIIRRISHH